MGAEIIGTTLSGYT
ncbi:hypothetical protein, partial [Escherichia coli]